MNRKKRFRWFIRITLILALVQVSILSLREDKVDKPKVDKKAKTVSYFIGEPHTLGPKALPLIALKEKPSRLVNLTLLASGSAEAQQEQHLASQTLNLPLTVENSIGMTFRLIPAGVSYMGSPIGEQGRKKFEGKGNDIEAQHRVEIKHPLYVGQYEVSLSQWKQVMGELPSTNDRVNYRPLGDDVPVTEITWNDAISFCKKLAKLENLPMGRYRLLKEAEWEYSCRAGTSGQFYFKSFKDVNTFMTYGGNSTEGGGLERGKRHPNAWGLFNMHGNVMEWCYDYYIDYFSGKMTKDNDSMRNVRGGSWYEKWQNCRAANRARLPYLSHGNVLGFRVVRILATELQQLKSKAKQEKVNRLNEAKNEK